jgi:WD40 repeat protein
MTRQRAVLTLGLFGLALWFVVAPAARAQPGGDPQPPFALVVVAPDAKDLARGRIARPVFRGDGRFLLAKYSGAATLWNVESGRLVRTFEGHQSVIHSVAFSPDERLVLTAAGNPDPYRLPGRWDFTARLWDVATAKEIGALEEFPGPLYEARFSPDGRQIVTLCRSHPVETTTVLELWNAETRERQFELTGISVITPSRSTTRPRVRSAVQFSPRGDSIVAASAVALRLWDATTGESIWHVGRKGDKAESPESETSGEDRSPMMGRLWAVHGVEFSPDGKRVLVACRVKSHEGELAAGAVALDSATGRLIRAWLAEDAEPVDATFCDTGRQVMTATSEGIVRLWDTTSGSEIRRFEHAGPIDEMAVGGDGARMTTKWRSRDEGDEEWRWFASLWDVTTGRELRRFELGPESIRGLTLSPDGRRILANVRDGEVLLLDGETGETIRKYE